MARRFHHSRPTRGKARTTTWFFFDFANTVMTATGGTLIQTFNAAALALRPFTIIRTHFELEVRSDQISASEIQQGAFGLGVVTDVAAAAGVASIPTPVSEMGSETWFAHQLLMNDFTVSGTPATAFQGGRVWSIDSKAMRKVEESDDIIVVGEFATGGSGFALRTAGRMLIKNN